MSGHWPFAFLVDKRAFDAVLDRLEAAHDSDQQYGMIENQADVAIAKRFVERWWDLLDHAEQVRYGSRLAYLKHLGKGNR